MMSLSRKRKKRWSIAKLSDKLKTSETQKLEEQAAEDSLELVSCAKTWIKQFNNKSRAKKCIEQAMSIADFPGAWVECLDAWFLLGDNDKALSCMEQAEETADDSYDFTCCAFYWNKRFGDKERAKKCLNIAEKKANCIDDYMDCVHYWIDLFKEKSRALKCMEKAEKIAKSSSEWYECAQTWLKLLHDKTNAKRCEVRAAPLD
jgi:tetratricopeptide (TPR) repeat protein